MRRLLDSLYAAAGLLGALGMVATLLAVLGSTLARLAHLDVQGLDGYAGYALAATGFLALAPTLRRGEHIRVTLLSSRLRGPAHRALELACHAAGLLMAGLLAVYAWRLVLQSWRFHDIAQTMDATPLWIPQLAMAVGVTVMAIAFIDAGVAVWQGRSPVETPDTGGEAIRSE